MKIPTNTISQVPNSLQISFHYDFQIIQPSRSHKKNIRAHVFLNDICTSPPPFVRGEILNQSVELQSVEVSQTQDFERWIIYAMCQPRVSHDREG